MKKHKFGFGIAIVSFLAAALSLWLLIVLYSNITPNSWILKSLFAGAIMTAAAVAAVGEVHLFTRIRRRVKVQLPKLLSVFNAVFLVLIFLTAFAGQTFYSAGIVPSRTMSDAKNEVVVLFDSSVSAEKDKDKYSEVATKLIDNMSDETALAMGFFTTEVDPSWELTMMDNKGKEEFKKHLSEAPSKGGTSLTKALAWAQKTLEPDSGAGKKQSIVIFTDGSSPIYPDTAKKITDSDINVYSIRPDDSDKDFSKDFVDFIGKTGGSDIKLSDSSSDEKIDKLIDECGGMPADKKENRIGIFEFSDKFVLIDDNRAGNAEPTAVGFLIRSAVFLIVSLLFQAISFRKINLMSIATALGGALIASLLVTLFGAGYLIIPAALIISLADFTVISLIEPEVKRNV